MIFKLSEKNNGKIVTDRMVSLKAKGLYFFLMHLDLEKDYSIEAISSCNKGTSETIRTAINELREFSYIETFAGNARNKKAMSSIPYYEVISHLNKVCDREFKWQSEATRRLIRARWKEGYRLDDFKKVIDVMYAEWHNTNFEKYLRPETLFRATKFESYLNRDSSKINKIQNTEKLAGTYL